MTITDKDATEVNTNWRSAIAARRRATAAAVVAEQEARTQQLRRSYATSSAASSTDDEYTNDESGSDDEAFTDEAALIFNGVRETEAVQRHGLWELDKAVQYGVSQHDNAAYLEAVRRVPHLVNTESDPIQFLRYEKYNAWAAAQRLCFYWRDRVKVYQDRAFYPMRFAPGEDCALEEADMAFILRSGASVLPVKCNGRNVLFIDRARLLANCAGLSPGWPRRFNSYLAQCLMEADDSGRLKGYMLLVKISDRRGATTQHQAVSSSARFARHGVPMKPPDIRVICCPPEPTAAPQQTSLLSSLYAMYMRAQRSWVARFTSSAHVAETQQDLDHKLAEWGFTADGLPQSLGGSLTDDQMQDWLRQRGYEPRAQPSVPR